MSLKRWVVVRQWAGNLVLILLALAWLQIPDSHLWQFAASMLAALLIVLAVLWLHASTFRLLRPVTPAPPLWIGVLLLALFVACWWLLLWPIGAAREHEPLYAGYWNSKLSPGLRYFFTYQRLLSWQDWLYNLLDWLLAALLLPLAMETIAAGFHALSLRRAARVYRRWRYWLSAVLCGFAGSVITASLADWTPGKGLAEQTASVLLRLGGAYTIDILLWCFMLSLAAFYLDKAAAATQTYGQSKGS